MNIRWVNVPNPDKSGNILIDRLPDISQTIFFLIFSLFYIYIFFIFFIARIMCLQTPLAITSATGPAVETDDYDSARISAVFSDPPLSLSLFLPLRSLSLARRPLRCNEPERGGSVRPSIDRHNPAGCIAPAPYHADWWSQPAPT